MDHETKKDHETKRDPNKINIEVTFSFYVSRAYSNARRFNVDHIPNDQGL